MSTDGRLYWPPVGWAQWDGVPKTHNQAIAKDIKSARVYGLSYTVESEPLYVLRPDYCLHRIQIDGWEYTIHNDSSEFQVLNLTFMDRFDQRLAPEIYISAIKAMARPVPVCARSARRAVMASVFLMKQIAAGQVPDIDRVLRIYKLHPDQARIYETPDISRESLRCGVVGGAAGRRKSWSGV